MSTHVRILLSVDLFFGILLVLLWQQLGFSNRYITRHATYIPSSSHFFVVGCVVRESPSQKNVQ